VFLHVGLLVEPFSAELARVRARVGVNEQVRGQRRRALEALATLATLEAAFGAVNSSMLAETDRVSERLPAGGALVRTLTAAVRPPTVNLHARKPRYGQQSISPMLSARPPQSPKIVTPIPFSFFKLVLLVLCMLHICINCIYTKK